MKLIALLFCLVPVVAAAYDCDITWDANPPEEQVTQYNIYFNGAPASPPSVTTNSTTCAAHGISVGRHSVEVTAVNSFGESLSSSPLSFGAPNVPVGVSATPR